MISTSPAPVCATVCHLFGRSVLQHSPRSQSFIRSFQEFGKLPYSLYLNAVEHSSQACILWDQNIRFDILAQLISSCVTLGNSLNLGSFSCMMRKSLTTTTDGRTKSVHIRTHNSLKTRAQYLGSTLFQYCLVLKFQLLSLVNPFLLKIMKVVPGFCN